MEPVDEIEIHRLADDGGPHADPDRDPAADPEPDWITDADWRAPPTHD